MKTRSILLIVVVLLLIVAGCQLVSDMVWPVKTSKVSEVYLEVPEEKKTDVQSLAQAKNTHQAVISHHINAQLEAKHTMEKDKANYDLAIGESTLNIETAEAEKMAMIGTIERPGWLTSILLGTSGFGLYYAGSRKQRPEDYNEEEHQAEVEKAVKLNNA